MKVAAAVFAPVPGCAFEATCLGLVAQHGGVLRDCLVFDRLVGGADPVAQGLEPVPRCLFERVMGHMITNEGAECLRIQGLAHRKLHILFQPVFRQPE